MSRMNDLLEILNSSAHLGEEVTPNGAKLIGLVKDERLGIKRWWHFLFPGLTAIQVADLEGEVGIPFPLVFSDFLRNMNGLIAFSGALCVYGARLSLDRRSKDAYPYPLATPIYWRGQGGRVPTCCLSVDMAGMARICILKLIQERFFVAPENPWTR